MSDINLIGTNKKRNITVTLPDEVSQKLLEKCAASGWDVNKLVENFLLDLTGNSRGSSRSAEKKANKWFEQSKPQKKQKKPSFLQWLIDEKLMNRYMGFRWDLEGSEALKVAIQQSLERHNPSHVKSNYEDYDNVLSRIREAKEKLNLFIVEYLKVNPSADMEIEIQEVTKWIEQREEFLEGVKKQELDDFRNEPEEKQIDYDPDEELREELNRELLAERTEIDMDVLMASYDEPQTDYMASLLDEEKEVSPEEKLNISDGADEMQEASIVREQRGDDCVLMVHKSQVARYFPDDIYFYEGEWYLIDEENEIYIKDRILVNIDDIHSFYVDIDCFSWKAQEDYYEIKLPSVSTSGIESLIMVYGEWDKKKNEPEISMLSVQDVYERAVTYRDMISETISDMKALGFDFQDIFINCPVHSSWRSNSQAEFTVFSKDLYSMNFNMQGLDGIGHLYAQYLNLDFLKWEDVTTFIKEHKELLEQERETLARKKGRSR